MKREAQADPEESLKRFRMLALIVFISILAIVYFVFDYAARNKITIGKRDL